MFVTLGPAYLYNSVAGCCVSHDGVWSIDPFITLFFMGSPSGSRWTRGPCFVHGPLFSSSCVTFEKVFGHLPNPVKTRIQFSWRSKQKSKQTFFNETGNIFTYKSKQTVFIKLGYIYQNQEKHILFIHYCQTSGKLPKQTVFNKFRNICLNNPKYTVFIKSYRFYQQ